MDIKILVADDDKMLRELVCDIIKKQGYIPVDACDGQQVLDIFFESNDIDLLILDVMMPVYDGWRVLKEIREYSDVPVIMLTALGDEKHEVLGLKKGADDYIAKPFSYEVLIARINTHLRKVKKERLAKIKVGEIIINQATHKVMVCDLEVELNRKEYSLLIYFIKNRNMVLTREQILFSIWGYDFDGDIRTIDTHVKTLRAKLLECGKYIKTVRGSGYMLEVDES
ncbi:response regulator transcription factor [Clostridium uliginosum]|uniref:Stage 0 sporulation protein A homolog n=1 Tax=Clostridium uliginosum TaxID=119641 RepID=A0A1I1QXL5_9CLOT|nr:response regulator transcription factor [Clostridium uliginosum]SFD26846.1 DNA-binding response regulator, OmpR family, contains REC and winged-helix (wHTH) domain [Clostridium uliginosum]